VSPGGCPRKKFGAKRKKQMNHMALGDLMFNLMGVWFYGAAKSML